MTDSVEERFQTSGSAAIHTGDGDLPPHHPTCFGCGPDAREGLHLQARREGDEIVAGHTFGERHGGAPGIVHGGLVATVLDDMMGFLASVARVPGVTRRLEVDYLAPALIGVPYELRARLERRDGRKLWTSCTGTGPDGGRVFTATALFVVVPLSHFGKATGGGPEPVAP